MLRPDAACASHTSNIASSDPAASRVYRSQPVDEPSNTSFGFVAAACRSLNECVQRGDILSSAACAGFLRQCRAAFAATHTDCQHVESACLSRTGDRLRIHGHSVERRSVHKLRRADSATLRMRLPRVRQARSAAAPCTPAANGSFSYLPNATLISPIWMQNFAESLLGAVFALHVLEPDGALLVAGSAKLRSLWENGAAPLVTMWRELLGSVWPGARLRLLAPGDELAETIGVGRLRVCHLHDSFDGGRRAFQGLQPSLLGSHVRQHVLGLAPRSRPAWPVRIGIISPGPGASLPGRRIANAAELVRRGCPPRASCEELSLDRPGFLNNLRAVLPFHAIVALHGASVAYAAFPERPFALLEVRPAFMYHGWFRMYHQAAFALDTWTYAFEANVTEHRDSGARRSEFQRQAAVLPLGAFRAFATDVVLRFRCQHRVT